MVRLTTTRILILLTLYFLAGKANAQFTVTQQTAQFLVENVLVGQGVTVSNITFQGDALQIGSFSQGNQSNLGINSGIVMTTGDATTNVLGPNNSGSLTSSVGTASNDPDITSILQAFGVGGINNNICIIEFDFVPSGDSLRFNYVFGSEEYDEWVCSDFFDAFGFFLSGPNINGPYSNNSVNLAIVPGTNLPVGINTVNNGNVGGSAGGGGGCPNGGLGNSAYYVSNTQNSLQMDGFTRILTAEAQVICNSTYHIKLVIANGTDSSLDSWVFLQAESFSTNIPNFTLANLLPDSSVVEGCTNGQLIFTRDNVEEALAVPMVYGGTAIPGVDYEILPDTIFFAQGQDTVSININPYLDAIDEGFETITLLFRLENDCGDTIIITQELKIRDQYELEIVTPDPVINCPSANFTIGAQVNGGYPPYLFEWSYNNLITPTINVPIARTDTFIVQISDSLDCIFAQYTDTVIVSLNYDSLLTTTQDTLICKGVQVEISAFYFQGLAPYTFDWDGLGSNETLFVTPEDTTAYLITITDACNVSVTDTFFVNVPQYDSLWVNAVDTTICKNGFAQLEAYVEGGDGIYSYVWTGPGTITELNDSISQARPDELTDYIVTVTDGCLTIAFDTLTVQVENCELQVGNAFSPNGDGKNDYFEIANIQYYPNNVVIVYNRWGKKVLEQAEYMNNWGAGSDVTAGTYFYVVDPGDGTQFLKGYVTVFKD